MADGSGNPPNENNLHASVSSAGSSSSYLTDQSFSEQRFSAVPTYHGATTSGSTSSFEQARQPDRPKRYRPRRPSLFASFPKVYDTQVHLKHVNAYLSADFECKQLEVDISATLEKKMIIYPKNIQSSKPGKIFKRIEEFVKDDGAFVFFGSSLLVLFNVPFTSLPKYSERLVGDVCIFTKGKPVYIFTIIDAENVQSVFTEYNSLLVQTIQTSLRQSVTGFRAVHGVTMLKSFDSTKTFQKEIAHMTEQLPLQTPIAGETIRLTIESFMKMIACSSFDTGDIPRQNVYLTNYVFECFLELMEEKDQVLLISSSAEFSKRLIREMASRLALVGKITLRLNGYTVFEDLHTLGEQNRGFPVMIVYERTSEIPGDICLKSEWKEDRKWVFQIGENPLNIQTTDVSKSEN